MRYVPIVLVTLYFLIGAGWRTWLHRRRYGEFGMSLFRGGRSDLGAVLLPLALLVDAMWATRGPVPPRAASYAGTLVVLASLALTITAQLDLGRSWRIGIDPSARPGLVTDGVYRYCRNPIFACMLLGLVGFTLVLPNLATLALVLCAFAAVHRQIRAEEDYLAGAYGSAYLDYVRRVPRYIPKG